MMKYFFHASVQIQILGTDWTLTAPAKKLFSTATYKVSSWRMICLKSEEEGDIRLLTSLSIQHDFVILPRY